MRVFISGGAGYIGSAVCRELANNPEVEQILIYDNLSRGNYQLFMSSKMPSGKLQFIQGDILDSRKLRKYMSGMDVVIHLAARVTTPFANIDSHIFEQVNHWGTAEMIYAAEEMQLKKFIYMSSAAVYGSTEEEVTEDSACAPSSFYGMSKWRAEGHVQRLLNKTNTLILRCGNVYGFSPSMRFDAVINKLMFDMHFHGRVSIHGNGRQYRSFIHVSKLSYLLNKMLHTDIPSGIYNLSDKNLNVLDLIETMRNIDPDFEFLFINQHLQMQQLRVNPNSKLYRYLALPSSDIMEELREMNEHFSF